MTTYRQYAACAIRSHRGNHQNGGGVPLLTLTASLTGKIRLRRGPGGRGAAPPSRPVLPWWAASAAALVGAGCFCALAQGPLWIHSTALAAVNLAASLVFVCTGLMLRKEAGQRGAAWALMLAGIFRSVGFIGSWNGPWPAYGLVFGAVDRLFGAWALLRYPNSSLLRHQRAYLILLAGWMVIGHLLIAVTSTAQWNGGSSSWWWPALIPDERLTNVLNYVVNVGQGVLGVALIVLLVMRLVRARGLDRIVIAPIIVAGIAAVVAASVSAVAQMLVSLRATPDGAYLTESAVDLAVPLAFLASVVQRAFLLRNITALTARLSAGADVAAVRHALRSILHDPTLDLLDLSAPSPPPAMTAIAAGTNGTNGTAGTAGTELDVRPAERLVEVIRTDEGMPIAVVIADPALARYRGLFDAAVQTSGLALKNAQLQAKAAREKLEQVRASRARIMEAGLAERRRLERDLHDGVQQHLLSITARLTTAMSKTADPDATAAFGEARDGLREVLAELRDLAHGIHPALLTQGGLAVALDGVAERLPLPVRVTAPATRVNAVVEATAYFVACEALANVVKHARADSATVTISIEESWLDMEITDDGIGGITPDGETGQGLANIADRVGALDGEVAVDSPPGKGTRLVVRIPCG
jgi:signal transduction histidine kinase